MAKVLPILSIIVPTFNRLQSLLKLLGDISASRPDGVTVHVVIVDDSADNKVSDSIRGMERVHCIKGTGNWWWTRSVNEGIKYALAELNSEYLLLLNDDSSIEPDFIGRIFRHISTNRNCLLGSVTATIERPSKISFIGVEKLSPIILSNVCYLPPFTLLADMPETLKNRLIKTYKMNGRGMAFHKSLPASLGLLDENLPQYGSDDDYALRAREAGFEVFVCTDCIVYDNTFMTSKGAAFKQDDFRIFIKSFFQKHSVNSIRKTYYFYRKRVGLLHTLLITSFTVLGTFKAYLFNYRDANK